MHLKYESIIRQMSLEEKARMMSGKNVWESMDFPKYGIPSLMMSDGPHGMRTQKAEALDHLGLNQSIPATCFPTAAAVANSWDESLGEEIGKALAEEARSMGVDVILGPGLNIKRSPLCGRNFEYFSEDPYHAGKMAAAYIRGMQSGGVAACPKHFAANSQELRRMASNSVVDERTFREIYTTGFEIAVKEGKAKSIMSSYNQINGVYANENRHLLREILVDEWGFDGFVVSDWGAGNDPAMAVKHGSHLEMPGTGNAAQRDIVRGIAAGKLTEEELDQRVDEFLDVIFSLKINDSEQNSDNDEKNKNHIEAHHALARKAAEESIVLLKNKDGLLPLAAGTKAAVIGEFAKTPRYQGFGSSMVNPLKTPESILDCILESGIVMTAYASGNQKQEALKACEGADVILIFAGLDEISETEGADRTHMKLPKKQNALIKAVTDQYSNVAVILSAGAAVEMPWKNRVKAIVYGGFSGQAGASAMLRVLTGKVNPSGKLSESYPYYYEDTPAFSYYPGKERSSEYREGLYVGYRYYTTVGKKVRFPFGYGLSYTTFAYSDIRASEKEVCFRIKNTGRCDGAEIVQIYIGRKSDSVFRPAKELKGFKKVFLKAGEEKEVVVPLDDKAFRFFDTRTNTWEIETGTYHIMVGTNANTTVLQADIIVRGTVENGRYEKSEYPSYFSGNIKDVSDKEFERLYGRKLPDGRWNGKIGMNDAICQLYYSKGAATRLIYHVLTLLLKNGEKKGKPNLDLCFVYNMPIRGIAKMTGGKVTRRMAYAVTEMANGHTWRGIRRFVGEYVKRNKK